MEKSPDSSNTRLFHTALAAKLKKLVSEMPERQENDPPVCKENRRHVLQVRQMTESILGSIPKNSISDKNPQIIPDHSDFSDLAALLLLRRGLARDGRAVSPALKPF